MTPVIEAYRVIAAPDGEAVPPLPATAQRAWVPQRHVAARPGFMRTAEPTRRIDPCTAHTAREHSIAQGDPRESDHPDRFVHGKRASVPATSLPWPHALPHRPARHRPHRTRARRGPAPGDPRRRRRP